MNFHLSPTLFFLERIFRDTCYEHDPTTQKGMIEIKKALEKLSPV